MININEPLAYVISQNLHRRQLTPGQKAFVAVEIEKALAVLAKDRQGVRTDLNIPEILPESSKGDSRDQAGEAVGVSGRYVSGDPDPIITIVD